MTRRARSNSSSPSNSRAPRGGRSADGRRRIASAVEEQTATTTEISRNVSEAARGSADIAENVTAVAQAAQNGLALREKLKRAGATIGVGHARALKNRKPLPDEIAACIPYLHRQLAIIGPKVILTLGGTAAEALLGVKQSLGKLRGKVHSYDGIPLVATYHPAALLRNPDWKKPTWDDVRIARQLLER